MRTERSPPSSAGLLERREQSSAAWLGLGLEFGLGFGFGSGFGLGLGWGWG